MFLRTGTKSVLEKSLGISVAELAKMDYDQEMSFVKKNQGKNQFSLRQLIIVLQHVATIRLQLRK